MKKIILFFVLSLISIEGTIAQTEVKDDYAYSENGFVLKEGSFKIGKLTYLYCGLYSPDGKVCIKVNNRCPHHKDQESMSFAPGTEIIAPYATAGLNKPWYYIPKSVKKIYSGALSGCTNIYYYNDSEITEHKQVEQ